MPATVTEHFYEEVGCAIQHRGVLGKPDPRRYQLFAFSISC
jgi:hypothetical protein